MLPFTVRKTLICCKSTLTKYTFIIIIVYKGCLVAGQSSRSRSQVRIPPSHPPPQSTMYNYNYITCRIEQLKLIDVHDRLGVVKKTRRGKRGGKKKTVSSCSKCTIIIFN